MDALLAALLLFQSIPVLIVLPFFVWLGTAMYHNRRIRKIALIVYAFLAVAVIVYVIIVLAIEETR